MGIEWENTTANDFKLDGLSEADVTKVLTANVGLAVLKVYCNTNGRFQSTVRLEFRFHRPYIVESHPNDTLEFAKLAAVEAWRAWTKAQGEAAGFVVADPVEPEVGGDK